MFRKVPDERRELFTHHNLMENNRVVDGAQICSRAKVDLLHLGQIGESPLWSNYTWPTIGPDPT